MFVRHSHWNRWFLLWPCVCVDVYILWLSHWVTLNTLFLDLLAFVVSWDVKHLHFAWNILYKLEQYTDQIMCGVACGLFWTRCALQLEIPFFCACHWFVLFQSCLNMLRIYFISWALFILVLLSFFSFFSFFRLFVCFGYRFFFSLSSLCRQMTKHTNQAKCGGWALSAALYNMPFVVS